MTSNTARFELYNGVPVKSGSLLFDSSNRAFRYGDGLFETIKICNGKPLFLNDHWQRLSDGITALDLTFDENFSEEQLHHSINGIIQLNEIDNARLRLTVYRAGGGLYFSETNKINWHLSSVATNNSEYALNKTGIKAGLFDQEVKPPGKLSNLKTLNCIIYILAANFAGKHGFDDVLLFNTKGKVIESIHSNLFIVSGKKLITPPLSDGCLNGVLRKNLLKISAAAGWICEEASVSTGMLKNADEILLTNVIRGVQWVEQLNGVNYSGSACSEFITLLNDQLTI